MKIGLITHLSSSQPLLIADLMQGLQAALKEEDELIKKLVGADAKGKEVVEEVQKMLLEDIDIIIAYSSVQNLLSMQEQAQQFGKTIILIDSNAHSGAAPLAGADSYWLSMQLCESNYFAGVEAKKKEGKIVLLSDFIHSGYQFSKYFGWGHETKDEQVVLQMVPQELEHLEAAKSSIKTSLEEEQPTTVFLNGHKAEADAFLSLAEGSEAIANSEWVINGFYLAQLGERAETLSVDLLTVNTWHPLSNQDEKFLSDFQAKSRRIPSLFGVLGFEAGQLVQAIKSNTVGDMKSPRGNLKWDEDNRRFWAPQYAIRKKNGALSAEAITQLDEARAELADEQAKLIEVGWQNAYLCY